MKKISILLIATLGLTACTPPAQQNQTAAPQAHKTWVPGDIEKLK